MPVLCVKCCHALSLSRHQVVLCCHTHFSWYEWSQKQHSNFTGPVLPMPSHSSTSYRLNYNYAPVLCILCYRQNIFHNIRVVFHYCEIILVRTHCRYLHLHYVCYLNRINKPCTNIGCEGLIALQYQGDETSEDLNMYPKRAHLHSSDVNIQSSAYNNYNNYACH